MAAISEFRKMLMVSQNRQEIKRKPSRKKNSLPLILKEERVTMLG